MNHTTEEAWTDYVQPIIDIYRKHIGGTKALVKPSPFDGYTPQELTDYVRSRGYHAHYDATRDAIVIDLELASFPAQKRL